MNSSSKMERFLPNECYVCKSRDDLIRCDCNLISYCSEAHRLNHLPIHEKFCKLIKKLMIEKELSHIYEELTNLRGSEWTTKQTEIFEEIKNKLGRKVSPLEYVMFQRPRICFVCYTTEQENLTNCPDCPVASFCENHPHDKIHTINCKIMKRYLNVLNTAEELNIDLEFLSDNFPCITDGKETGTMGELTKTFIVADMRLNCTNSRLLKVSLINLMNIFSKLQNALQKIYGRIPEEIVIHIDALSYKHAIRRENYWEFLFHLNPMIRELKIVIVVNEILNNNLENCSLCESCSSKGKKLTVTILAKSYDDYMLDENYQKPDILFYVKINDECNSERLNKWSELDFPIVLRFDINSNFCKTQHFLSFSTAKFKFIYEGQLTTPFATLSSIENRDYFIILQSKEKKVLQKSCGTVTDKICEETIDTNRTEIPLEVKKIGFENLQYKNNSTDAIADTSKITPSELKDNSDNNEKSKLETNGNQSAAAFLLKAFMNENTKTNETEVEENSNNEKMENKNLNILAEPAVHTSNDEQIKEQKSEDKTLSPSSSSSVCSFVIISKSKEEEKEKKEEEVEKNTVIENSKPEENDNCSKSIENDKSSDTEEDEKNNTQLIEKRREEEEEQKNDKDFRVKMGNFDNSQTNFSQLFLIDHISYLNKEIDELRKRLNASIEEVSKQQTKYEQSFSTLIEENKLMRKVLCDIVNTTADIDSVLKIKS
ncbi:uncharacterized protein LOC122507483 [Leptopilina heterotoma]|uniref:uncharacterized protein LOC122507483 n=1 Tax=Leptopilina heterotoma TaxID=63436 RepID=UPI001CA938E0|nr:uncharacterized protein LOC122507483 [Leptopilina heterotoma]